MFTPAKMEQIQIVFSDRDLDRVVNVVVQSGVLQMVDAADVESWAQNLSKAGLGDEPSELRTRRERVENLIKALYISYEGMDPTPVKSTWEEVDSHIVRIENQLHKELDQRDDTQKEIVRLQELRDKVGQLPQLGFPLENRDSSSYLAIETGRIANENMSILQQKLHSVIHILYPLSQFGDITTVIVIVLRRDRDKLASALREAGFTALDLSKEEHRISPDVFKEMDQKIDRLKEQLLDTENQIKKTAQNEGPFLRSLYYQIRISVVKQQAMKYLRKTDNTYLLSGWIPMGLRESFVQAIRKATQNRCVIEETRAEEVISVQQGKVDVPVQFNNPSLIRPFELLTGAYGVPAYRTLDPTPILGISFMLMFGMMFGDVGHGLILVLTGLFLLFKKRTDMLKNAGILLCYVGGSSMVFGFLFGSLFGFENLKWLPPLWMKPMESISALFRVAVYFGIVMIFMAIVINMINAIRQRKFLAVIFDKAGLLAAMLYWCGIVIGSRIISNSPQAKSSFPVVIPVLMVSALVLLFFREPIIHLMKGKKKLFPEGVLTGVISGLIELMEIILGFLSNTVSFIRVAAFGLVHAGLSMAIFSLSDAVGGVGSVFVILFGNILIILLEGLIVSIQAVRLEFYEFFSRFYQQGSVGYHPIKIELERPL